MNSSHLIEWLFVAAAFIGLIYLMIVIKEEKAAYKDNAISMSLHQFTFEIPSWWTQTGEATNKDKFVFERTDTRYEWKSIFLWNKNYDETKLIQEQMVEIIKEKKLELDRDATIILNPSDFEDHEEVKMEKAQIVRVEGTGTYDEVDRVYYDAYLIRDLKNKSWIYCESKSSILNGMLEGPYFEEAMNNFKIVS